MNIDIESGTTPKQRRREIAKVMEDELYKLLHELCMNKAVRDRVANILTQARRANEEIDDQIDLEMTTMAVNLARTEQGLSTLVPPPTGGSKAHGYKCDPPHTPRIAPGPDDPRASFKATGIRPG